MHKTGLVFFPAFDWAIEPTHPEREERLLYTRDQIFEEGVMDLPEVAEMAPRLCHPHDILRTHFCVPDVASLTTEAHLIAAGAGQVLGDEILAGRLKNGFALVRPPGHHAMRVVHGNRGFCNINNEAVVVEYLRRRHGIRRVAIVDTDVHHGDGTQDIFYHDPDVLFISFHQDGRTIYPGTGFSHELGGPTAFGRTLNIPLPPGTTDESMLFVLENLILPVLNDFGPELVVNSAGQDNHYSDPIGEMCITARGYATLTSRLKPHLAVLEGGYAVESALPYVNLGIILALAGLDFDLVREADYPRTFHEDPARRPRLEKMVRDLLEMWRLRDQLDLSSIFGREEFFRQQKEVYYDTDGIEDKQVETVRVCKECPGYLTIDSRALHPDGRAVKVMALSVPLFACNHCRSLAYDAYAAARKENSLYHHIYLQDKSMDTFLAFDTAAGSESISEG